MPYKSVTELPAHVKKRSPSDQERWMKTWNDVFEKTGSESKAFKAANAAINMSEPRIFSDAFPDWNEAARYVVQVMRSGSWKHPDYGDIDISNADLATCILNFRNGTRRLVLDYNHGSDVGLTAEETKAAGWLTDLWIETLAGNRIEPEEASDYGSTLAIMGLYEVTEQCNAYIKSGEFRFYSPTFNRNYRNKETGDPQGMTLLRGAITNTPFLDGMESFKVAASERAIAVVKAMELAPGACFYIRYVGDPADIAQKLVDLETIGFKIESFTNSPMPAVYSDRTRGQHRTEEGSPSGAILAAFLNQ